MRDDLKKGGEEYQKLLEQANDQAISADQRDKRKQAAADKLKQLQDSKATIDQYERQSQITLSEQSQRMRENILSEIKVAVSGKAKAAGYLLVIDAEPDTANATAAVVYSSGENDLTDEVLKQLNASAPIDLSKPAVSTAVPLLGAPTVRKKSTRTEPLHRFLKQHPVRFLQNSGNPVCEWTVPQRRLQIQFLDLGPRFHPETSGRPAPAGCNASCPTPQGRATSRKSIAAGFLTR